MDNTSTATLGGGNAEATHHWWQQRLTAGANLALFLWFIVSIALLPGYDYDTIRAWIASPLAAVPMLLLVISTFYHFRLGLQVVIEDYAHDIGRVVMLVLLNYFTIAAATLAIFSILKVAFSAGAA